MNSNLRNSIFAFSPLTELQRWESCFKREDETASYYQNTLFTKDACRQILQFRTIPTLATDSMRNPEIDIDQFWAKVRKYYADKTTFTSAMNTLIKLLSFYGESAWNQQSFLPNEVCIYLALKNLNYSLFCHYIDLSVGHGLENEKILLVELMSNPRPEVAQYLAYFLDRREVSLYLSVRNLPTFMTTEVFVVIKRYIESTSFTARRRAYAIVELLSYLIGYQSVLEERGALPADIRPLEKMIKDHYSGQSEGLFGQWAAGRRQFDWTGRQMENFRSSMLLRVELEPLINLTEKTEIALGEFSSMVPLIITEQMIARAPEFERLLHEKIAQIPNKTNTKVFLNYLVAYCRLLQGSETENGTLLMKPVATALGLPLKGNDTDYIYSVRSHVIYDVDYFIKEKGFSSDVFFPLFFAFEHPLTVTLETVDF